MKRFIIAVILVYTVLTLFSCATAGSSAENIISLNQAIREAAEDIENRLELGVKIALLNFSSPSEPFSEYVLEELSGYLVNTTKLVVVERRELDLIRQEERFQLSGEVSDESAQAIGKKLGAQVIVSGSLSDVGKSYRFRIKTLIVETAAIATTASFDVNTMDERVVFLLAGAKPIVEIPPEEEIVPEGLLYEVIGGESITITQYIGSSTNVHIPASINGLPVTMIGVRAFNEFDRWPKLTSVTIPSSVTTIGNDAFSHCENLSSISLPSSVTSIGRRAFYQTGTTNITIPSSVTTIGEGAFAGCIYLTDINVEIQNTAYMSVNGVLFEKNGRTLVCYPAGKSGEYSIPSSVTLIGNTAFRGSRNLTSVHIPSSVVKIGDWAFSNTSLTFVYIPSSVTTIGYGVFADCRRLTDIVLSRGTGLGIEVFPEDVRVDFID